MELLIFLLLICAVSKLFSKKKKRRKKPRHSVRHKEVMYEVPCCALDKHTCPICAKYDGVRVERSRAVVGVNIPPFHEGCRCTVCTESSMYPSENDKRFARNPLTNEHYYVFANTYQDWVKSLKKKERLALIEFQKAQRK